MILVTGANGHLGANLLRRLLAEGDRCGSCCGRTATIRASMVSRSSASLATCAIRPRSIAATKGVRRRLPLRGADLDRFGRRAGDLRQQRARHPQPLARGFAERRRAGRRFGLVQRHRPSRGPAHGRDRAVQPVRAPLALCGIKAAVEHECLKAAADGLDVVIAISCAILGPNDFKPSRMGQVLIDYCQRPAAGA